jgi:hypothetical protein
VFGPGYMISTGKSQTNTMIVYYFDCD